MARILVVDDDGPCREITSIFLSRCGRHTVVTAANADEALSLLERHPFDLVVLDILMPDTDGFELLSILRRDRRHGRTPVVVVTAMPALIAAARERGADHALLKPFDSIELCRIVDGLLARKRRVVSGGMPEE